MLLATANYFLGRFARQEERIHARLSTEHHQLADVYKRALQAAADYRMLSDFPIMADQWRAFLPRLHELRAEFTLYASPAARTAFDKYVDDIDDLSYEKLMSGKQDEAYWNSIDKKLGEMEGIFREEIKSLRRVR